MNHARPWWPVFWACAAVVLAALAWVTATALRLERDWLAARAEAGRQEALRLALWRMDSWLAPLLAREAARPSFTYESFYAPPQTYTKGGAQIEPGEVLSPSPLLSLQSGYIRLHFQVGPEGAISSPQVPTGWFRQLAEGQYVSAQRLAENDEALAAVERELTLDRVAGCVAAAAGAVEPAPPPPAEPYQDAQLAAPEELSQAQQAWSLQELSRRKEAYLQNQNFPDGQTGAAASADPSGTAGSFVGFWTGSGERVDLVFARPVRVGGREVYQGFLCDWARLRGALLGQIADLFEGANLMPVRDVLTPPEAAAAMLATIPARLDVPAAAAVAAGAFSPARATLLSAWAAVLAGLIAVAVTLRASIDFGRRRSRFASAVTHELRTPLTTFRMYSEMLAEGMVEDPQKRRLYLQTLRDESARLSGLVENVLAYARLEEGRRRIGRVEILLEDLLERVVPPLRQRTESAGMTLIVTSGAPARASLRADPEAVGQILFNLVDNACKYAASADDRTIHLAAAVRDGRVTLTVRDHGPGVDPEQARAIFAPFDRGGRGPADPVPGVGLGLALARGLAAELGGKLELAAAESAGACFRLTLPAS